MILLPKGENSVSPHWINYGEASPSLCLDDDNGNTSTMSCADDSEYMIIEFAAPSVAEGDIDFSVAPSVRYRSSGRADHRTTASLVTIAYEQPLGNPHQINSYDSSPTSFETLNGIARTASDGVGMTDWTYSDLENLEMRVTKLYTIPVVLTYLAMEVTYTEAVTADNTTFFGANF